MRRILEARTCEELGEIVRRVVTSTEVGAPEDPPPLVILATGLLWDEGHAGVSRTLAVARGSFAPAMERGEPVWLGIAMAREDRAWLLARCGPGREFVSLTQAVERGIDLLREREDDVRRYDGASAMWG